VVVGRVNVAIDGAVDSARGDSPAVVSARALRDATWETARGSA